MGEKREKPLEIGLFGEKNEFEIRVLVYLNYCREDITVTKRLKEVGSLLGISLLDHIIIVILCQYK